MNNLLKKHKIINIESLKEQLLLNYKKRNLIENKSKLSPKSINYPQKHINYNIIYIKLKKSKVYKKLKKQLNNKLKTYVENHNQKISNKLLILSKKICLTINTNKNLYRSIHNECLIETVAKTFAHSILLKEKFNVFESFSDLTKVIRVYKKEAEILNVLIINELINIYLLLLKDINIIKTNIKKGRRAVRVINLKHKPPAFIYGLYLYSPRATKFLYQQNNLVISATTKVLNELDTIYLKQRIVFNYIKYLSKGIL